MTLNRRFRFVGRAEGNGPQDRGRVSSAGKPAFLMELDPLYCDVIVQRWEKFTERLAEVA